MKTIVRPGGRQAFRGSANSTDIQAIPRIVGRGAHELQNELEFLLANRPRALRNERQRYLRFCLGQRARILRAVREQRRRTVQNIWSNVAGGQAA